MKSRDVSPRGRILRFSQLLSIALLAAFPHLSAAQTNFTILKGFGNLPGGVVPFCPLITDPNGVLYGTTVAGGVSTQGVVFAINPDGSNYRVIKEFSGTTNGMSPYGALVLASDGRLYGTTYSGGTSNFGTVFGLNTDGSGFATLHSFTGSTDGKNPRDGLIEGKDGALYGTTYFADTSTRGTVFKVNKNGTGYSVLHIFTGAPDGQQVTCKLLEASDGLIYGVTPFGGTKNIGTIFVISSDGSIYYTLFSFGSINASGYAPVGGVIECGDGNLYGVANLGGGTGNSGVIYKIDKGGVNYQILYHFPDPGNGGQAPAGDLLDGADGTLYGVTQLGGTYEVGSIYKINKDGSGFMVLRSFSSTGGDANEPLYALLQLPSGLLYGTLPYGGPSGTGCIFALSNLPLRPRLLSLSTSASSNVLQFSATSSVQYDVERSMDLSTWTTLGTSTSPIGGQTNYTDINPPQSAGFYRLQQH